MSNLLVSSFVAKLVDRIPPLLVVLLLRRRVKVVVAVVVVHPRLSIPLLSFAPLQVHRRRRRLLCAGPPSSSPFTPKAKVVLVMVFPRAFKKVLVGFVVAQKHRIVLSVLCSVGSSSSSSCLQRRSLSVCMLSLALSREYNAAK